MQALTGGSGADTFNALAVNPATGAAQTVLNPLDSIDGGLGKDTLNITMTAANNNSLTGVTVKNVEVINLTGANNLGTSTTTTATNAANAGAAQVQVLDIGNLSLEAEQQTIDFVGTSASGTSVVLAVNGVAVTATTVAADNGTAVATKVAAAINTAAAAATAGTALSGVSASATSGVVTLQFPVAAGDALATAITNGLTGTATITETKTSSAEIQSITITTGAAATNTATIGNIGSAGNVVYTATATRTVAETATDIANAINTAIGTAANTSADKLVRAEADGAKVNLIYKVSAGDATIATAVFSAAGIAATGGMVETRKGGEVDHVVSINGAKYTVTSVVDPLILSTTPATALTAQNASKNALRTAVNTELTKLIGDSITVGISDDAGEIKLTSKTPGTAIPGVSVTSRDSTSNLVSVDAADAATVANAEITSAGGAVAQQIQYTVNATAGSIKLFVNGVDYGSLTTGTDAAVNASTIATAVNAVLGAGVAVAVGGTVTVTAPVAGTPLPVISMSPTTTGLSRVNLRDNVDVLGTTTTTTTVAAAVSGATFAGSEQIWLVGADSNKTNVTVTTQAAGLRSVTGLDNTINFGAATAGVLAVEASTGKSTLTGAAGGLTVAGTTGTLALTNTAATAAAGIKSLTVDMSGASSFDVSAMNQLTNVTSKGAGAVTINTKATTKVNSITTGDGADTVRINTATLKDDITTTTVDETINAVVNTGAGADVVRVGTSGTGNTTVETGAGGDTIYVQGVSSGVSKIDAGADNDTVHLNTTLGANPNLTIDGGAGTDTLVMAGGTLNAVDYLRMNTALSNFEAVRFTSATNLDASKLAIGTIGAFTFNDGTNVITEVAGQSLTLAARALVAEADFVPAATAISASSLTATAAGYKQGASGVDTVYGGALTVNASGNASIALTLQGSSATVGVTATGGATTVAPTVTLGAAASDLQSLTVNLTSGNATAGAAVLASFTTGIIADTSAGTYNQNLESLSSFKATGSGQLTVNNSGSNSAALVSLTSIDVSGMTAFFAKDTAGAITGNNLSVSTITLNDNAAETITLGGARDTVVTGSTVAAMDTIIGFQLSASAASATVVDTAKSDVLNVADGTYVKFTTSATSLVAALTEAGAHTVGGNAADLLVFHFGGDTYVYSDTGANGLTDNDGLVKMTGLLNLDLLVQTGVLI